MKRLALLLLVLAVPACGVRLPPKERDDEAAKVTGGDPKRGKALVREYGCLACHTIPGLPGEANVGPDLDRIGSRVYVAGVLVNNPANLIRWLQDPPGVDLKTAMPNLSVGDADARDLSAFLYTLR